MEYKKFKCSAIHNLIITKVNTEQKINEGIYIPTKILNMADMYNGQEVIITRIGAGPWKNRIKTFIVENTENNEVEVRGSLAHFLREGDLTCLIAECYISETDFKDYENDDYAIFDLGFDPKTNKNNTVATLDLQYRSHKEKNVAFFSDVYNYQVEKRKNLLKCFIKSLVIGLKINSTHPDCLQGSAELPRSVMEAAKLDEYKSVSVYNSTQGGVADTYSVPMPEGVVMTTGAMASFANIGETVNVAGYVLSESPVKLNVAFTDGEKVCE